MFVFGGGGGVGLTGLSGVGSPPEAKARQRFERGELFAVVVLLDHGAERRPRLFALFTPPLTCERKRISDNAFTF